MMLFEKNHDYPANIHCWAEVGKLSGLLAERRPKCQQSQPFANFLPTALKNTFCYFFLIFLDLFNCILLMSSYLFCCMCSLNDIKTKSANKIGPTLCQRRANGQSADIANSLPTSCQF